MAATDITIAADMRIYTLTGPTGSYKSLRELLASVLAGKSGAAATLPKDSAMSIALLPAGDLLYKDSITGDGGTIASGTRREFPCYRALDLISIQNNVAVELELYFD